VDRVDTYKELDSDLLKHAAFATLDDVSLRLLTKCLNLESEVKEVGVTLKPLLLLIYLNLFL
jgi:intraflagellar transport protein 43